MWLYRENSNELRDKLEYVQNVEWDARKKDEL